ncbi:2,4'-dihydroxyacetophenone dioxygenase family protein [Nocardia stercoris]|uniref:Cupin n=1 Tax=Nocardia stercoris TaxID=2483361 RepID=A0A3M2LDX2_9NOCA|nr:2,4'-dihydroxyacetophenone dioxygenase family protein [Nocardia stercoris]RMI35604.1 cupin [Nocardia stercoris]
MLQQPLVGHVNEADIPWVWAGDVGLQLLRVSPSGFVLRNRFKAGFSLPTHKHTGAVNAYTFSGDWFYAEQGIHYTAGTFIHEPAGSVHTLTVAADSDVLFIVEGAFVDLDADGNVTGVVDSTTIRDAYFALCDLAGIERPTGILE